VSRYHGGWLGDELTALCSLAMGVRLKSGGVSRYFDTGNSKGRPCADTEVPPSPLPKRQRSWVVPRAHGEHNIQHALVPRLASYPGLQPHEAITLVRSARLYQDAIWMAESEPELAWLLMVSAIEVVATHHQVESFAAKEILRSALPDLCTELVGAGGEELVERCAGHMSRHLRATNRFLSFLLDYLPSAPPRPGERVVEIEWTPSSLKKSFGKIYNYRSLALHDGTPFPRPMCDPPSLGGFHQERPAGIAAGYGDAAWLVSDCPMLLHVFEHITRNAVLAWWDARAAQQCAAADEAPPSPSVPSGPRR
jgi:hypothetical protein